MFTWPMLRSLLWKLLYGAVVTMLGVALDYVKVHPDPQSWALAAFLGGLSVAVVAFLKKFATSFFTGGDPLQS